MAYLIIEDKDVIAQLREIAERENQTVEEVISAFIDQYREQAPALPSAEALRKQAIQRMYERARKYWREAGDEERARLTDEQLDEQFWLFEADGSPHLKSEQGEVEIPDNSLYGLGEALANAGFRSGRSDIASRSKEILQTEFAEYLIRRAREERGDAL